MKILKESIANNDDNAIIFILNIILHINRYPYGKDMIKEKMEEFTNISKDLISKYPKDSPICSLCENVKENLTAKNEMQISNI